MLINDIVNRINKKLAGELLTYAELKDFLDDTIDDINTNLNAKYPAFSELPLGTTTYDFFPDKWIRKVVVPGASWYYFVMDEEGSFAADQYAQDFQRGMFLMIRDHSEAVPEEYQDDPSQGSISFEADKLTGPRGIEINGEIFRI